MKYFADKVLNFLFSMQEPFELDDDVEWLMPYADSKTKHCMEVFYKQYYGDRFKRTYILGINPGRFGAGLTGVPFTDPIRLKQLGIQNDFPQKPELSSVFIYEMIQACGGPDLFYRQYYITSLSPLGFTKHGKNYNYYDDPHLCKTVTPFMIQSIETQIQFGANRSRVFCLGQGKNYEFLMKLNQEHGWWKQVIPLPHPRWIMQYRLKEKQRYIQEYTAALCS